MRAIWLLLSFIPGLVPLLFGRLRGGLTLFAVAALGIQVGLYARWFLEEDDLGFLRVVGVANLEFFGVLTAFACSLLSFSWTFRMTSTKLAERRRVAADASIAAAQDAYLKGDLEAALEQTRMGLRIHREDVDLLFLEGQFAEEAGNRKRARRARRRLRRFDLAEKWIWESEREEAIRGR